MAPFYDSIFKGLSQEQLEQLSPHLQLTTYHQGQVIVLRGEILNRFYVILSGRATAQYRFKRGQPSLQLGTGDFFGETAVLEELACDALVRAEEDGTTALAIELPALKELLERSPSLRHSLLDETANRRTLLGCGVIGLN